MGLPPQFFNGMDIHLLAILRNIGDVNGKQPGGMISPMNWRDFLSNERRPFPRNQPKKLRSLAADHALVVSHWWL